MRWILLALIAVGMFAGCDESNFAPLPPVAEAEVPQTARANAREPSAADYREQLRQVRREIRNENIAANYRRAIEWEREYLEDTKRFNEPSILYEGGKEVKKVILETEDEWARKGVNSQLCVVRERRKEILSR